MSVSTKPASGFRDFLPQDMRRRNHVADVITQVFESYGFQPLGTPCVERLDALLGKYGEEGDQLIFRILKRGEKLQRVIDSGEGTDVSLADAGLRYDLTVPLARVFAEYRNDLPSVFKRYQIAPVWRADRPQRGRFREFFQCDVDVVGSTSMVVEAEVTAALADILKRLEFKGFRIHVNHRQLLRALMEVSGIPEHMESDALIAIDKLDKIGRDGVVTELLGRGINPDAVDKLMPILDDADSPETEGFSNQAVLEHLESAIGEVESGRTALDELKQLLDFASGSPAADKLYIDPYLARGLSYYTGPIFEIRSDDFPGSIGGGGRYDGLIGMFSKQDVPACGFSLGFERILVLMEERGMFDDADSGVDALVTVFNEATASNAINLTHELRAAGLNVDVYTTPGKYKRQFKYADERNIPFVCLLGPDEVANGTVAIKNMKTGDQVSVSRSDAAKKLIEMRA